MFFYLRLPSAKKEWAKFGLNAERLAKIIQTQYFFVEQFKNAFSNFWKRKIYSFKDIFGNLFYLN